MNTFTDFTDFNTFPEVEFSDEEFDFDDDDEYVRERPVMPEYPSEIIDIYDNIMSFPCRDTDAAIELMQFAQSEVENAVLKYNHKQLFRNHIAQELIAEAMHPRRMMARISQFDDFERFFEWC
jgi:hypothetical protein